MRILKYLFIIIGLIILAFAGLIITAGIKDYQPNHTREVYSANTPEVIPETVTLNVLIWNIGFCGLSDDMDFFYDDGNQVRTSEKNVIENCKNIIGFMQSNDSIDFYLLQEVDVSSKRSFRINQYDSLKKTFPKFIPAFGKNYDVFFVPLPFYNPLGKITSGLVTLSRFNPGQVIRYSFHGNYSWPMNLFMLDRCFLVNRHPLTNGKELLIINTHNSAYDDGSLKEAQMMQLKSFIMDEYLKGNYIVVGGDWNQLPNNYNPEFQSNIKSGSNAQYVPESYVPDNWQWGFDNAVPTNRSLSTPYDSESSAKKVIDYYLFSPNIKVIGVKGIDLDFKYSDHQPVIACFKMES